MPRDRNKRSTLPESKRGSVAKLAKRIHTFCVENHLSDRMQVLLYGVVEGQSKAELKQRLGCDLEQAKRAFLTVTDEAVDDVARRLIDPADP